MTDPAATAGERQRTLNEEIRRHTRDGFQIQHHTDDPPTAQLRKPKPPVAWKLNLLLTLLTLGAWLLIWIPLAILSPHRKERVVYLEVEENGKVRKTKGL